jgi:hypothetical protein
MPIPKVLSFAAAYFSLIVAVAVLFRDRHSHVHLLFSAGRISCGRRNVRGFSAGVVLPEDVLHWQERVLIVSALLPGIWLAFSVNYARANTQKVKLVELGIAAICLAPVPFIALFRVAFYGHGPLSVGAVKLLSWLVRPRPAVLHAGQCGVYRIQHGAHHSFIDW